MREKICFITPQFKTGGGNRVFVELANILVNKGYEVELIYPNNSNSVNNFCLDKKISIIEIGSLADSKLKKLSNLLLTLMFVSRKRRYSVVLLADPIMSIFAFILGRNHVYRFVQANDYIIYDDLFLLKNRIMLAAYKFLTRMSYQYRVNYIFNSRYTFDSYIDVARRSDVAYKLVHPAVNHQIFYNRDLRDGGITICVVGRIHPLKGFSDFISAWRRLQKELMVRINMAYVITHDQLDEFDTVGFTVVNPKNDEEIADIFNKSHIFISTSWWEGFGLPPLEAMACGCAVIMTFAGGVMEYAENEVNCLMYQPRDIEQLCAHIRFLTENPDEIIRLATNGISTAKRFSWERSTEQLIDTLGVAESDVNSVG